MELPGNVCSPASYNCNLSYRSSTTIWRPNITDKNIQVSLHNKQLWDEFYTKKTEMILSKRGRRMFPAVEVKVSGLEPNNYYFMLLQIVPADEYRYKYLKGTWAACGEAEPMCSLNFYKHPDSPARGSHWMTKPISFDKVKLTNSPTVSHLETITESFNLRSLRRYITRIFVVEGSDLSLLQKLNWDRYSTFLFDETSFFAVTAYQNNNQTQLKIDYNPYAKGFRDAKTVYNKSIYTKNRKLLPNGKTKQENGNLSSSATQEQHNQQASSSNEIAFNRATPNQPLPSLCQKRPGTNSVSRLDGTFNSIVPPIHLFHSHNAPVLSSILPLPYYPAIPYPVLPPRYHCPTCFNAASNLPISRGNNDQ